MSLGFVVNPQTTPVCSMLRIAPLQQLDLYGFSTLDPTIPENVEAISTSTSPLTVGFLLWSVQNTFQNPRP